jgi:hypothetical protein
MVKRTWSSAEDNMQPQKGPPLDDGLRRSVEPKGDCYDGDIDEDEPIFDAAWNEVLEQEAKESENR